MPSSVAFTGHRHIEEEVAGKGIMGILRRLQPEQGFVGGAVGADTLAAERLYGEGIPYVMALPHHDYPSVYGLHRSGRWRQTFERAMSVIYVVVDAPWNFRHNFTRNEWLVDHAELLIAVSEFDPFAKIPAKGGTAHCVRYARKVKRVIEWVPSTEVSSEARQPQLY